MYLISFRIRRKHRHRELQIHLYFREVWWGLQGPYGRSGPDICGSPASCQVLHSPITFLSSKDMFSQELSPENPSAKGGPGSISSKMKQELRVTVTIGIGSGRIGT